MSIIGIILSIILYRKYWEWCYGCYISV
jgi:hypothetical protein